MPKEPLDSFPADRTIFFCDAVVAIAITLLIFNLRLADTSAKTVHFRDIFGMWRQFVALALSFILIALFWKNHHDMFRLIAKMSDRLLWYNMFWLMSIVLLPFSTLLISFHFDQVAPMVTYSFNILLITIFQNQIWDYVAVRPDFLNDRANPEITNLNRLWCNVAMINAILAILISFLSPVLGFLILLGRPAMMKIARGFQGRAEIKPDPPSL